MAGYITHSIQIDREYNTFDFYVDYTIDAYIDPETEEYFDATSWYAQYSKVGGDTWTWSDYGAESGYAQLNLGLDSGSGLRQYTLTFNAMNTFSAVSVSAAWNVFSVAYDTAPQTVAGSATDDIIIGGSGGDSLDGLAGNDTIDAGDGDDTIAGGDGADQLVGGAGDDSMIGGAGDDRYDVQSAGDRIAEAAGGGYDRVDTAVSYTLSDHVDHLFLRDSGAIDGSGGATANRIDGNSFGNLLSGHGGDDTLYGGGGRDRLVGGSGNDLLDLGTGRDTAEGGIGNDTYVVDSRSDEITETADAGIDTVNVRNLSSYVLGNHFERLVTLEHADFAGTGNGLRNELVGGRGNDTLDGRGGSDLLLGGEGGDWLIGGAGGDELRGGSGSDTADYAASPEAVVVDLATGRGAGGTAQGDRLHSVENVVGSAFADVLAGNARNNGLQGGAGDDTLTGGDGNDRLHGGAGADSLDGGGGTDTVSYAGSVGGVTVDLALGTASGGDAAGDVIANFERVIGGTGQDSLTGNAGHNRLSGEDGADTIKGGDGNDIIVGGSGADSLDGGSGIDWVSFSGATAGVALNLQTATVSGGDGQGDVFVNFENAEGGAGNDSLTGNGGRNVLAGEGGADTLKGAGGNDTINGGAGADSLDGGTGIDWLSYAGSTNGGVIVDLQAQTANGGDATGDRIRRFENARGSDGHDQLYGGHDDNRLVGEAGFDLLDGRFGNDTLTGGDNDDTFVFGTGYGHDVITDFDTRAASSESIALLLGEDFDSFAEIMAVAQATGTGNRDTVFRFDADTSLTLLNVSIGSLMENDFQL